MKLIDRYVFMLFARVFMISFVCLTGVYIVGDFVNNLNEFIDIANAQGGMHKALWNYYGARMPMCFEVFGRVVALIAAIFAVTWLQRHNEMTALMAAGLSRWRIITPLLVGVALISGLGAANREFVLPQLKNKLSQSAQDLVGNASADIQPRYDQTTNILIKGKGIILKEQTIVEPDFALPLELTDVARKITGEKAVRLAKNQQHPAGYLVSNVKSPDPQMLAATPSIAMNGRPTILTSHDHAWLEANQCFIVSDVAVSQLSDGRSWRQFASTPALIKAVRNPSLDLGADVSVTIHSRIIQPVLDITLFFLGMPVVLSKETRNVFIAIGSCLLVVTVFFVVVMTFQTFGNSYLIGPAQAVWYPLMILIPWAAASSNPLRT